jgi:hypothetical protein
MTGKQGHDIFQKLRLSQCNSMSAMTLRFSRNNSAAGASASAMPDRKKAVKLTT